MSFFFYVLYFMKKIIYNPLEPSPKGNFCRAHMYSLCLQEAKNEDCSLYSLMTTQGWRKCSSNDTLFFRNGFS